MNEGLEKCMVATGCGCWLQEKSYKAHEENYVLSPFLGWEGGQGQIPVRFVGLECRGALEEVARSQRSHMLWELQKGSPER